MIDATHPGYRAVPEVALRGAVVKCALLVGDELRCLRSRLIKHLLLPQLAKLISAPDLGLLLFVLLLKLLVTPGSDNNKIKHSESCYLRLICSNSLRFLLPLLLEVQGADLDDLLNSISLLLLLFLLDLLLLELAKCGE